MSRVCGEMVGQGIYGACSRRDAVSPAPFPARAGRLDFFAYARVAPRKRPNRAFLLGLARGCFKLHTVQEHDATQASKQAKNRSPKAAWAACDLPNMLLAYASNKSHHQNLGSCAVSGLHSTEDVTRTIALSDSSKHINTHK